MEALKNKKYWCIKEIHLPKCDGDGFETDEYFLVKVGTTWSIPEDEHYRLVGGEVRPENSKFEWIEISNETLEECFKEVDYED